MESDGPTDGPPNVSSLRVSREILGLIAEMDEFKGAWLAIGRLAPERLSRLRHAATIESVGSSTRIEGARLSDPEVEQLLSAVEVGSFATRDEQEVAGYADTMNTVFTAWEVIDLTENHVRQLHRDLLQYSEKDERHRGSYKTLPNHVEAFGPGGTRLGVVFETAAPFDTPRLTAELFAWTRNGLTRPADLHPLLVIAVFIVAFLAIHPFQDGNGRLSRILTTLLLLRAGYAYAPYSSLESVIERSRDAYYPALRRTQRTLPTAEPDWNPWLTYFLTALQRQKRHLHDKIERERLMIGDLPALSLRILELARDHGRVTIRAAAAATGASRNTIKDHVRTLTRNGRLTRHGSGRGTWYAPA